MSTVKIKPSYLLPSPEMDNIRATLVDITANLDGIFAEEPKYRQMVSKLDKQVSTYLHELEFLKLTAPEMMQITKKMKQTLILRRKYKNLICTLHSARTAVNPDTTIKYIDKIKDKSFAIEQIQIDIE